MGRAPALLTVIALAAACSESRRMPSAPSPMPTASPVPLPPSDVTGIVYEMTSAGARPLAGVGIDMSPEYQSWPPTVMTDAEGRYSVPGMGGGKLVAEKTGYSQPCRVPVTGREHDIYLVPNDFLSTAGMPASFPVVAPVLDGSVFEQTPEGRQPIAGASIILDFTGGDGWAPSARTTTDALGRYLLCNVVDINHLGIAALVSKAGYRGAILPVTVRPPGTFDIELRRH